jgi:hypothetical protein
LSVDEPETIKQKAKLREIAEAEMMLKAGKASTKLEQTRRDYNAKNPPAKAAHKVDEARPANEAYQLYVQHWNNAKNNPALQKKLTDRAREMGIVK